MKLSCLFTASLLTTLAAFGNTASADHSLYRELDDLNNHAMIHARDARWEVQGHFVASRDYRDLLQDSRSLTKALRNVEDAIFFERSPYAILSRVRDAHDALLHFEEHAEHSDFSQTSWHGRVRVRPAGYSHIVELRSTLRKLHQDMDLMIAVLEPLCGHQHGHELEVIPDPEFQVRPEFPTPGPSFPGLIVPESSASTGVTLPFVRTRSGGAVVPKFLH